MFTSESAVHFGQVGQPSPEEVSRTRPPVPTSTIWPTRYTQAMTFSRPSTRSGSHAMMRFIVPGFLGFVRYSANVQARLY